MFKVCVFFSDLLKCNPFYFHLAKTGLFMRLYTNSLEEEQKSLSWLFAFCLLLNGFLFGLWFVSLPIPSNFSLLFASNRIGEQNLFGKIVEGPIFLRQGVFFVNFNDLAKEFSIFLFSDRPDQSRSKEGEIFLHQSKERRFFQSQERIYFSFGEGKMLQFSEKASPLWLEIQILEKEKIFCRAGIEEERSDGLIKEEASFQVEPSEKMMRANLWENASLQKLSRVKWVGEDFLSFFLQSELSEKRKRYRLEAEGDSFLIKEGDWLTFQEGHWNKVSQEIRTEEFPLAIIGPIKELQMEIEFFDERGNREKILLNKQAPLALKTNPEEWIVSLRERNPSSISIGLERQHFLLRKGSWVLRKNGRWKICKPFPMPNLEAEAFFFFEGMEEKEGQKRIKAHFFNSQGTMDYPIDKGMAIKKRRTLKGLKNE
jgi:hypothetical protein